jgi:hypothetical protein
MFGKGPRKDSLGRISPVPVCVVSSRFSSAGNCACTSVANLSNSGVVTVSWIMHMRFGCWRAAIMSSSSPTATGRGRGVELEKPVYRTTIGSAGQQSKLFLTGVPWLQNSCKSRKWGELKIIYRHLRHTWTSLCHFHGRSGRPCEMAMPVETGRSKVIIIISTSSGSLSITAR